MLLPMIMIGTALAGMSGCAKDKSTPDSSGVQFTAEGRRIFLSSEIKTIDQVEGIDQQQATIRADLAAIFCQWVYKLPLQSDFSREIGVLCTDNAPNDNLGRLDRFAKVVGDTPRPVELDLRHDGDFTHATYATAYALNIPPKWVKSGAIHDYMMASAQFADLTLDGAIEADRYTETGGDLQFSKFNFSYATAARTPDGGSFQNRRETEFNAYQVQGGNPDIGIGTEHLIGEGNPDFEYFNTITVTIGTESGGSILITIIRGSVRHNGFPDTARKIFSDTTLVQGVSVHDGLTKELSDFAIRPEEQGL